MITSCGSLRCCAHPQREWCGQPVVKTTTGSVGCVLDKGHEGPHDIGDLARSLLGWPVGTKAPR